MIKKFIKDSFFNIIAIALPIISLQLIILPTASSHMTQSAYGYVLTLISLSTIVSFPLGSVLNNIRLLFDKTYADEGLEGDFNIMLFASLVINTVFIFIAVKLFYPINNLIDFLAIIIFSSLNLLRGYLMVDYRLKLNYQNVLINNILMTIGYFLGLLIYLKTDFWQAIYLSGNFFGLVHLLLTTTLLKEAFARTKLFLTTVSKSGQLYIASILMAVTKYVDRLLIFPLLGSSTVTTYYIATLSGKMIGMVVSPFTSVLLSYLVKIERIQKRQFAKLLLILVGISISAFLIVLLVSQPLLKMLYPKWFLAAMKLVPVMTAVAVIDSVSTVINPLIMRFMSIKWQPIISAINVLLYFSFIYIGFTVSGIFGFCLGVLAASVFRLIFLVVILNKGYFSNS